MTIVVLIQKCFSTRGGWPEPSKFTDFYENLLANCPYKNFFDTATLCDPANAAQVEALSRMEEKEATSFFDTTFRGRRGGPPSMPSSGTPSMPSVVGSSSRGCQRGVADVYKTICKKNYQTETFMNVAAAKDFHSKRFLNVLTKGRIQRPLSPPPSPPGPPIAHSTLLPSATGRRRFRRPTFNIFGRNQTAVTRRRLSAKKTKANVTPEEIEMMPLPLRDLRNAAGGVSVDALPDPDSIRVAPPNVSTLPEIREEEETEVEIHESS